MNEKLNAAKKAVEFVENGIIIGLGSGSTVAYLIPLLKEKKIYCVPTSFDTKIMALKHNLKVKSFDEVERIDLAIDGADFVFPNEIAIKGGGGAHTQEKIIDYFADEFVIIVDESKLKKKEYIIPIEIIPISWKSVVKKLKESGLTAELRMAKSKLGPVVSDNGNWILDAKADFEAERLKILEKEINNIPGVVENGIFSKPYKLIIGNEKGATIQ